MASGPKYESVRREVEWLGLPNPKAVPRPPKWVSSASSSMYGRGVTRVVGNKTKPLVAAVPLPKERMLGRCYIKSRPKGI
eukprot:676876-Amphidinium_carterae.1